MLAGFLNHQQYDYHFFNPSYTPQKFSIDTKNCHFLRELPFPNHHFGALHVSFREGPKFFIFLSSSPTFQVLLELLVQAVVEVVDAPAARQGPCGYPIRLVGKPIFLRKKKKHKDVFLLNWLVVSTHLKNISQNWNLPQIGMKIKNV